MDAKNFENKDLATETFLADETTCCLCGTTLTFDHKIDYLSLKIVEDAHCPSCQIQMKSREHKLQ
jgi:uncharacterized protein CbrC (UPF0167 family)